MDIFAEKHIFSKNISVYVIFNDQSFNDTLTNDIVSFEQLGPGVSTVLRSWNVYPYTVVKFYTFGVLWDFFKSIWELLNRPNWPKLASLTKKIWHCSCFQLCQYSWLSLSRTRLSRITAYLEVKIWSLPKHENLTTGKKYCGKEEKLLPRSNFSSFPQYFQYISNFKSPITYKFVKCGCSNYVSSANLICRSTDISKYFSESLGIRDNESRLYMRVTEEAYLA